MFPAAMPAPQLNKTERQLIKQFKALNKTNQSALVAFSAFLQSQQQGQNDDVEANQLVEILEPVSISRPEKESVIKAIKRLSATYPMVDKENILHPITDLMTAHMLKGEEASKVIDQLEVVFLDEYKKIISEM